MSGYQKYLTRSDDPRFPSFLQGFNQRWSAPQCEAVYVCHTTAGVVAALGEAVRAYGKHVRIKSGGHCYEDFVFNPETKAVIDVTHMNAVGHDAVRGYYLESGGTNWSAFQQLFRDYGKVLPAGSCYSVGLGGHICGGGYGLLSRLNGLTVDWLSGVEVVTLDAEGTPSAHYVTADSPTQAEKDLFWAHCGGGGGNFGVITKYFFKDLPESPASAWITQVTFAWSDLSQDGCLQTLLDWFADFASHADNGRQFGILALHHAASGNGVVLTIQTAVMAHEASTEIEWAFVSPLLAELEAIAPYSLTKTASNAHLGAFKQGESHTLHYTFYEAVQTLNGSGANQRGKYKSAYMRKQFPADQVATILEYLNPATAPTLDMTQCLLQIDTYGGQINAVAPEATPVPQRSSIMKLQYQAYWTTADNDQDYLDWIGKFYEQMYAAMGKTPNPDQDETHNVDGCYYNYPDSDLNKFGGVEAALKLYFGVNLPRLQRTKSTWDPGNYFNSAQSIR